MKCPLPSPAATCKAVLSGITCTWNWQTTDWPFPQRGDILNLEYFLKFGSLPRLWSLNWAKKKPRLLSAASGRGRTSEVNKTTIADCIQNCKQDAPSLETHGVSDVVGGIPAEGYLGVRRPVAAFGRDDKSSSSPRRTCPISPTTSERPLETQPRVPSRAHHPLDGFGRATCRVAGSHPLGQPRIAPDGRGAGPLHRPSPARLESLAGNVTPSLA